MPERFIDSKHFSNRKSEKAEVKPLLKKVAEEDKGFETYKRENKDKLNKWRPLILAVALAVGLNTVSVKAYSVEHNMSSGGEPDESGDVKADDGEDGNKSIEVADPADLAREFFVEANESLINDNDKMLSIVAGEATNLVEKFESREGVPYEVEWSIDRWKAKKQEIIEKLGVAGVEYFAEDKKLEEFIDNLASASIEEDIQKMSEMADKISTEMISGGANILKVERSDANTSAQERNYSSEVEGPPAPKESFAQIESPIDRNWVKARLDFNKMMYKKLDRNIVRYLEFYQSTEQSSVEKAKTAASSISSIDNTIKELSVDNSIESIALLIQDSNAILKTGGLELAEKLDHQNEVIHTTLAGSTETLVEAAHIDGWSQIYQATLKAFWHSDVKGLKNLKEVIGNNLVDIENIWNNQFVRFDNNGNLRIDKNIDIRHGFPVSPLDRDKIRQQIDREAAFETRKPPAPSDREQEFRMANNDWKEFMMATAVQAAVGLLVNKITELSGKNKVDVQNYITNKKIKKKVVYFKNADNERIPVGFEIEQKVPGKDYKQYSFKPFSPKQLENVELPVASADTYIDDTRPKQQDKSFKFNTAQCIANMYARGELEIL